MNSFILTISGVLFLLTCGLSMPTPCKKIGLNIVDALREDVACDKNVTLFVPSLENVSVSVAAKCFQSQLATIRTECKSKKRSTVGHANTTLHNMMVQKDAECILETNKTVSLSDFLSEFKEFIQRYVNSCSASKQK